MEMHQVRYFLALSNTLNFTRAAEECNVTQPALTRSIKQLEDELGGELIRRERNHSHLTELGRRMQPLLQQCYDAANSAKNLAKAVRGNEVASLAVAISNSINIELAMPAFAELFRAFAGIQLRIRRGSPDDIIEALKNGDVEVAIAGLLEEHWDRLDCWPLFSEKIELAVGRDHRLGRDGIEEVSVSEFSNEPLVHRIACEFTEELSRYLAAGGVPVKSMTHEVETDHDLLALIEVGGGIGFVSTTFPHSPATRRVRVRDLPLTRTIAVYGVAGRHRSPAATSLINLLRSADWASFGVSSPA